MLKKLEGYLEGAPVEIELQYVLYELRHQHCYYSFFRSAKYVHPAPAASTRPNKIKRIGAMSSTTKRINHNKIDMRTYTVSVMKSTLFVGAMNTYNIAMSKTTAPSTRIHTSLVGES